MNLLDLISGSVLNALGCDMQTFVRYFPVAQTMYDIFVAIGLGLLLLNCIWQLVKNFGLGIGIEAEDPFRLACKTVLFMLLIWYANDIVDLALQIGGTPYQWIVDAEIPPLEFASFMSVITVAVGNMVNGSVLLISLVLLIVIAWNYIKLLLEAAERYILLGVLVFTAPMAFALGAAQSTSNIFKSWCRMLGGQIFLLTMNAWCLKLFTNMVGHIISNPLDIGEGGGLFIWFLVAIGFLKVSQKIDSFMGALGISVGHTGGSMLGDLFVAAKGLGGIKKLGMLGGFGGKGGAQPAYSSSGSAPSTGFFSGGLSGMVSRKAASNTASNLTADTGSEKGGFYTGLGSKLYNASVGETGGFASKVVGGIATGSVPQDGMITGEKAMGAFEAYMGPDGAGIPTAAAAAAITEEQQSDINPAAPIPDAGIPMSSDPSVSGEFLGAEAASGFATDGSDVVYDTIPGGPEAEVSYIPGSDGEGSSAAVGGSEGIPASADTGGTTRSSVGTSSSGSTVVEDAEHRGGSQAFAGGYGSIPAAEHATYRDIAMGGGRITGVEMSPQHPQGIEFCMYHAGQFQRPEGKYATVTSRDGEKWYKQYAQPAVERTPISEENGKVKYHEKIVQKLPKAPPRHGR